MARSFVVTPVDQPTRYLESEDIDGPVWTDDLKKAQKFPSVEAAMDYVDKWYVDGLVEIEEI